MTPGLSRIRKLIVYIPLIGAFCGTAGDAFADQSRQDDSIIAASVTDARSRFREVFCAESVRLLGLFPDERPCGDALVELGTEPISIKPEVRSAPSTSYGQSLVFIPGIFGECVEHFGTPFSDTYAYLSRLGYKILVAPVEGRSSSERNGKIINAFLARNIAPEEKIIVVGYSKGVSDFLEALSLHPSAPWVAQLQAFVSIAGAVRGTPLADNFEELYRTLLSKLPLTTCSPGDGAAVDSLTRSRRISKLTNQKIPVHVELFSLVAFPASVATNPLLLPFRLQLSSVDNQNDGQLFIQDAILPGSFLLGYANADHWAIALPFNRSGKIEALPLAIANAYPREILLLSILAFVREVVNAHVRNAAPEY